LKHVKHLIFDLDHTLWDFDRNSKLAYAQIFDELDLGLDLERFITVYEPLNLKFWRRFRESEITKEELRYQRLKSTFDNCSFSVEDELINQIADAYLEYLPNYNHLFPDCIEVLEQLRKHYEIHLLTNGFEEVQMRKLKESKLSHLFTVVLTAERAGFKKPDYRIFEMVVKEISAAKKECVMIGDSLEADILGARNAGLNTVWFNNTGKSGGGGLEISSLKELLAIFKN